VERTRELIDRSGHLRDHAERAGRARFLRLFRDPTAIDVTIALTDEVMRIRSLSSSTRIFRQAAATLSWRGFGVLNAWACTHWPHRPSQ